ncbi:MAG: hypothetical protein WA177_17715, partial [Xanthobacteraceae bacterium]
FQVHRRIKLFAIIWYASACWPGVSKISTVRKDGRSQRVTLANDLRANAADMGATVHGRQNGRGGTGRQGPIWRRQSPLDVSPRRRARLEKRREVGIAAALNELT